MRLSFRKDPAGAFEIIDFQRGRDALHQTFENLAGADFDRAPQPNAASFFTDSSQRTGRYRLFDQQSFDPLGRRD